MKTLAHWAPVLAAACVVAVACGSSSSRTPTTTTPAAPAASTATSPRPSPAASTTAVGVDAPTTTAASVTTGIARSSVNAASPTKCSSSSTQFTEARSGTVTDAQGTTWRVPAAVHEGDTGTDLYNDCTGGGKNAAYASQLKTVMVDPDGVEITAYVHADNYFELYVNGTFVCRDPIAFTPFNSTTCRFKAKYPLTYAIRAVDWEEHLGVGLEYDRLNVGDGGLVASFSDGTVTDATWKAETFYIAPVDDATCLAVAPSGARDTSGCSVKPACVASGPLTTCKALHFQEPADWIQPGFNDAGWGTATVYTREQFGPKEAYTEFELIFGAAKFIWSRNLNIDNLVLVRKTVGTPPR